jgi:hypothetical protein
MYKTLETTEEVNTRQSYEAASLVRMDKPKSHLMSVTFSNGRVSVNGTFEGKDLNLQWNTKFERDELPTEQAKTLFDNVVAAVDALHLDIRKEDKNFGTDKWAEVVEETEEESEQ